MVGSINGHVSRVLPILPIMRSELLSVYAFLVTPKAFVGCFRWDIGLQDPSPDPRSGFLFSHGPCSAFTTCLLRNIISGKPATYLLLYVGSNAPA